jgi:cyclohexadieny/prephenate dehydrogenase
MRGNRSMTNSSPLFNRLALIGFGLIGGSIARAAKAQNLAAEIVATDHTESVRKRIIELNVVDRVAATSAEAVKGADP